MQHDEDLALSRRAAGGDSLAFRLLVEKHEAALRAFLMRMAGPANADDIAQEAFLKAWRAAGQFDGRSSYRSWLTRIAWRCRIDELRRTRPIEVEPASDARCAGQAAAVNDMLARLSERERAVIVLCDGHGWTHVEAAEMLDLPLGTLKSTATRARARCRAMWQGDEDD